MEWIKDLRKYQDERYELIQIEYRIDDLGRAHQAVSEEFERNSDDYQKAMSDLAFESEAAHLEKDVIYTKRLLRLAYRWRIPVPSQPYKPENGDETWEWNNTYGRYRLSMDAQKNLRRQIYEERQMFITPWTSIVALTISIISLAVSALRP